MKRVVCNTRLWATAFCVLVAAVVVEADEVTLKKGDVLRGRIIKATESSVTLVHEVFGELEVPKDQIVSITLAHDVFGEITIGPDGVASFGLDKPGPEGPEVKKPSAQEQPRQPIEDTKGPEAAKDESVTSTAVQAAALDKEDTSQEEEEEDALFEPEFERLNLWAARLKRQGWSASIDFSINTASGNTNEQATRLGANVKRLLRDERLDIDMSYYHKRSEGRTTDDKFTTGVVHDWLQTGSRWFFFAAGRYDYDQFKSWRQRANAQGGPGYGLIQSDKVLLDFRFGAGGRKEWGSINNNLKLEGIAGISFDWKITKSQHFDVAFQLYPVLTDFSDYRTRATLNWRYVMSRDLNLSLLFGVVNEYQSVVDPGTEELDTRVFTGIQMSF